MVYPLRYTIGVPLNNKNVEIWLKDDFVFVN